MSGGMPNHFRPRRPSFCPNARCKSRKNPLTWRYVKKGFFFRDRAPKKIQRYRCTQCNRSFSSQTFAVDYWLRRPDLLGPTFHRLVSCSGFRQIAREFGVSHSTIRGFSDRLGRHCLLFQEKMRPANCPQEPIALDGLRTFEHSQYWPMDLNIVVGQSLFVYGFNDAELRRSGSMRPKQKVRRIELEEKFGRPDPRATEKQVEELLRRIVPPGGRVVLRTDEHQSYSRSTKRLTDRNFQHEQTSSKAARTTRNPLFPVNLSDMLLRHCSSNHKRETIAFSKRRQSMMYRAAIWQVWRNFMKDRSENAKRGTPAMALGLVKNEMRVEQILSHRLFHRDFRLSKWLENCFFGRIRTRAFERCTAHTAKYAQ